MEHILDMEDLSHWVLVMIILGIYSISPPPLLTTNNHLFYLLYVPTTTRWKNPYGDNFTSAPFLVALASSFFFFL